MVTIVAATALVTGTVAIAGDGAGAESANAAADGSEDATGASDVGAVKGAVEDTVERTVKALDAAGNTGIDAPVAARDEALAGVSIVTL